MKKLTFHRSRFFALYVVGALAVLIAAGAIIWSRSSTKLNRIAEQAFSRPSVSEYGPAPEFAGLSDWMNSEPLTLADLKGKVVLIDFWTYSCINCIRTVPQVVRWYETYKDKGFVVIGIHTPEFDFEKVPANVSGALEQYAITYPVALDNMYETWQAYNNHYWPAHYLIDQSGNIVYTHFGEGEYDVTENKIRSLLGLDKAAAQADEEPVRSQSPEMYFGLSRIENIAADQEPVEIPFEYHFPQKLSLNNFALQGRWKFDQEYAESVSAGSIRLRFKAAKVHFVAEASEQTKATILIDSQETKRLDIADSGLYTLFESGTAADRILEIRFDRPGLKAFTFTFG